jgi:putative protease
MMHTVELLAPAGSREAFLGAVSAGADAVYLAGQKFGARAYAGNFTEEELIVSLKEAHLLGRKIYLTVNTLTREEELPELTDFVSRMYEHGLDGVIVQDLGVISALRKRCPGLLLHASTQLSVTGAESVRFLKDLGVCRVVPARELSLKEMKQLKEEGGIEVEAFIHGAMCYCYSGRCLMSGFLGGRSGNRGRCACTCRLPYRVLDPEGRPAGTDAGKKEYYPISMKDMSVLDILPDLMDAGIDSFKIEGRMKKPEYAAGVTSVYRRYIDYFYKWDREGRKSPWRVKKEDRAWLTSLYIRTEIGTGYYYQDKGRDMLTIGLPGYAGADPAILEEVRKRYLSGLPRLGIKGRAFLYEGQEAVLEVEYDGIRASARGIPVSAAQKRPVTEAEIRDRLSKTGDTLFVFDSLQVSCGDGIFIPNGALNALRREALSSLEEAVLRERRGIRAGEAGLQTDPAEQKGKKGLPAACPEGIYKKEDGMPLPLYVSAVTQAQADAAADTGCSVLIADASLDIERPEGFTGAFYRALPSVFRVKARRRMADFMKGCDGLMVRTLEQLEFIREAGFEGQVLADASIYQWNGESAACLDAYADARVLSWELDRRDLKNLLDKGRQKNIMMVYGRVPLMVSEGCLKKTENVCSGREEGFWKLLDRKNKQFPCRTVCSFCYNVIYNSLPLSLHQYLQDPAVTGCDAMLISLTTEDAGESRRILKAFMQPAEAGEGGSSFPLTEYTNGHFRKGVL